MEEAAGKRCATCRWCIRQDVGYSNWTVEDTTWDCLKGKNAHFPALVYDDEEKWRAGNEYGASCPAHEFGDGPELDVDYEAAIYKRGEPTDFSPYCNEDDEMAAALQRYMNERR